MHGVVAHIESGVRTLNEMQVRELVRMLGALIMDLTALKIKAEGLLGGDAAGAPVSPAPAPTPTPAPAEPAEPEAEPEPDSPTVTVTVA